MKKVGLAGCGYWGKNLCRNFYELSALHIVCDQLPENRALAEEIAPGVATTASFEELLASEVDAIVLATPAHTHFKLALKALQSGKDVFVEKPLALTLEEGEALRQAQGDRMVMVGHILEYHPACVKLVELVRSGALGTLRYFYSNRLSLGKVRTEENVLWSFAPHDIALLNRIAGEMPLSVSAFGQGYLQKEVADTTITYLEYPNGVRGHIYVSWLHPFKEQRLTVIGEEKMAVFNGVTGDLILYDEKIEWENGQPIPLRKGGKKIELPDAEPLKEECRAFLHALETRQAPLTDSLNGLQVLSVLKSAQHSMLEDGKKIPVKGFS